MSSPPDDAPAAVPGTSPAAAVSRQVAFYDNVLPPLPVGDYQIIIQDNVTADQEQASYSAVQRFRVTGPRVALGPTDVVAMTPPAGSQGAYDTWLPHVVLAQRSLPWQVPIGPGPAAPGTPSLALLLLTSQEINVAGAPPTAGTTGVQTVPLSDLLTPPSGTLGPTATTGLQDLRAEQPGITCTVVDVTFDAFRAVAPQTAELPFLAHVRQVDASDQEALQVPAPGWYSVVVGNRFPVGAPDNLYIVHLVSLEGFAGYLPDQPAPTGYSLVRLVSLASWSFTSGPAAGEFGYLMQRLGTGPITVPVTAAGTDAASQLVASAVQDGYTMLGYTSRLGEQTVAWYRGPLLPAPAAANPQPPFQAAVAALIYDPTTGIFDASYAAAWEIGRLLTLANGPVAISLSQWVASAANATRLLQARTAAGTPGQPGQPGQPTPVLAPDAPQRAARQLIARQVVPALLGREGTGPVLGPARGSGRPAGTEATRPARHRHAAAAARDRRRSRPADP